MGGQGVKDVGRIKKSSPIPKRGDLRVQLRLPARGYKNWIVSNLVAFVFIGPKPNGKEVNHKDLNFLHNCYRNLEYVSHIENIHHAVRHGALFGHGGYTGEDNYNSKLTWREVRKIRKEYGWFGKDGLSTYALADKYGISQLVISKIINNKIWIEETR